MKNSGSYVRRSRTGPDDCACWVRARKGIVVMLDAPEPELYRVLCPFDRCDREEDYRGAWAEFEERFR